MVDTWNSTVPDYNGSFCDGVRRLRRMLPKGGKRDQVARIALATNRGDSSVWNSPQTFNMDHPNGLWQGVVKPELERKVEQQHLSQALMKNKPIRPIPEPEGGADSAPPPHPHPICFQREKD